MTSASKSNLNLSNLKILRPKVTKNLMNLSKKFCEFPPRYFSIHMQTYPKVLWNPLFLPFTLPNRVVAPTIFLFLFLNSLCSFYLDFFCTTPPFLFWVRVSACECVWVRVRERERVRERMGSKHLYSPQVFLRFHSCGVCLVPIHIRWCYCCCRCCCCCCCW